MIIIRMNVSIYILFVCAGMIFKKVVNVATFELKMLTEKQTREEQCQN